MERDTNTNMNTKLIFVYNADGNIFSKVTDFAHKIISPATYSCNLCTLTYGNMGIKKEWADFIKNLQMEVEFLHKDEFLVKYGKIISDFPIILAKRDSIITTALTTAQINGCSTLKDLEEQINFHIKRYKQ